MGHYAVLVIHRPTQTVDELLAPYDENLEFAEREERCECVEESNDGSPFPDCDLCEGTGRCLTTSNPNSQWDWYLIGGQFSGALTGYNAAQDPENWEVCRFCHGTGQRADGVVPNGCTCGGTGKLQKHPSKWKPYGGDTLRVISFRRHPTDFVPSAGVLPSGEWIEDGLVSRYAAVVEGLEEKKTRLRDLLAPYPDCLVTVVDCHF